MSFDYRKKTPKTTSVYELIIAISIIEIYRTFAHQLVGILKVF